MANKKQYVLAVPNFSEGRDTKVVNEIVDAVRGIEGVKVVSVEPEADFNRTVVTMAELHRIAREELHCEAHAPFMHLAFLSLTTSPKWKITDKGVVDANNYCVLSTVK